MTSVTGELEGFRRLYEFSRLLLTGDDAEDLVARLVDAARAVTVADEMILFRLDGGEPRIHATSLERPNAGLMPRYSATLLWEVIRRQEPMLLTDVQEDPTFERAESIRELNIVSAMGAPLLVDGRCWGILYASRHRLGGNFEEEHRDLMTVAAAQASLLLGKILSTQALKESERRHRALIELMPSAILVVQEGKVVFCNRAAVQLWRRRGPDELLDEELENLFDAWRSRRLWESLREGRAFEAVEAWAGDEGDESAGCSVEVRGGPLRFNGSMALQLILNEVGEQKALMARRLRADRLMAMGTMAATVGHEINNPLSYVQANLDFVFEELEAAWIELGPSEDLAWAQKMELLEGLRSAREGTERIRAVVESIQSFSRLGDEASPVTSVDRPLESSLRVARHELGPDVTLTVDLHPTAPVPISAARLGQVFLNLLINAAQALARLESGERRLEVRTRQVEEEVIVEVADTGPGIAAEVQQHIFEPFVTTREEGTGLGLAISAEIVTSAGGVIEVDSAAGRGCLFRIRLPAVEELASRQLEAIPVPEELCEGAVLIIDPDPAVAASLARLLKTQHDVVAVSTLEEALEALEGERELDVILCDLRFRGGIGRDVFQWIEENAPQYWDRLVAMAAGRASQAHHEFLSNLPNPWVTKPFDLRRLRSVIASVLDEQVGGAARQKGSA